MWFDMRCASLCFSPETLLSLLRNTCSTCVLLDEVWRAPFHLYSLWLTLWLCSDLARELCGCTVFCFLPFPVTVITQDVFDAFASPFLTFSQTAGRTPAQCTSAWRCYRSREGGSAGTERQNTSWLGCCAAVCADSTTSSSWQTNKLYLQPFSSPPAAPPDALNLSACVDKLRRVNDIFSSPYLLLFPLSSSLTFSLASWALPWCSSTARPGSENKSKKHLSFLLPHVMWPPPPVVTSVA